LHGATQWQPGKWTMTDKITSRRALLFGNRETAAPGRADGRKKPRKSSGRIDTATGMQNF